LREILGKAKTIRELLSGTKYSIDLYQREYKWGTKQVKELVEDLTGMFLENYDTSHERKEVRDYSHYFLGSVIISRRDTFNFIIDGQQRLTTLTLLLMFLNNLQKERPDQVGVKHLIFSEQYGEKSFNINVEERTGCMEALFERRSVIENGQVDSVKNIIARYGDIEETFPEELQEHALPYFLDWLVENVHLVEITAYSDEDAYRIFETMNDRGLSLTPTEMLKGFLLAGISDPNKKTSSNNLWKRRISELSDCGKDIDADMFKAWLRSQYANSIRERRRGAMAEDFDLIGTEFHRWVRDHKEILGLDGSATFVQFIERDFNFYSKQYLRLMHATAKVTSGLEHVFYNAQHGFTMQYHLLLSPIMPEDTEEVVMKKMRLVAIYVDIFLNRRLWNFRSVAYSTVQYTMFSVIRDIRCKTPGELALILLQKLEADVETNFSASRLSLHGMNRHHIHRILARITDHIERRSDIPSRYTEYVSGTGQKKYEVEHIWANMPERHTDEFPHAADFTDYRNRIGGLLLLPRSFNGSYGALPYEGKLPHYYSQNLLAKTLNESCYDHNPGFERFKRESGLPFQPHSTFRKEDLDERQDLYRKIAEHIWDPKQLLQEITA
jgi:hypothetical protein